MITTWYLMIIIYKGGVDHIPQVSREQCMKTEAYVRSKHDSFNFGPMYTYCIQGVK